MQNNNAVLVCPFNCLKFAPIENDHLDITEILLKVELNTIPLTQ